MQRSALSRPIVLIRFVVATGHSLYEKDVQQTDRKNDVVSLAVVSLCMRLSLGPIERVRICQKGRGLRVQLKLWSRLDTKS